MGQSISQVLVHVAFSTKGRRPLLDDAVRPEMHAYLASVLQSSENVCVRIGGVADHVHVAMFLGRTESLARLVERLKVSSSKWIKTKGPEFARFGWQRGYAAFSVGLVDRGRWCGTSMGRRSIIGGLISRRRCGRCFASMGSALMSGLCGIRRLARAFSPHRLWVR